MGAFISFAIALAALPTQTGTLQGHIFIGPITPLERPGHHQTVPPSWYKPYSVLVSFENEKMASRMGRLVPVNAHGDFRVELNPGNYMVRVVRNDNGRSVHPLPQKQVFIGYKRAVTVNFHIDTGIR